MKMLQNVSLSVRNVTVTVTSTKGIIDRKSVYVRPN